MTSYNDEKSNGRYENVISDAIKQIAKERGLDPKEVAYMGIEKDAEKFKTVDAKIAKLLLSLLKGATTHTHRIGDEN